MTEIQGTGPDPRPVGDDNTTCIDGRGEVSSTNTSALAFAEELRAAAFRVREVAAHAAGGPWTASPVWSSRSHATSAVYSLAHDAGSIKSEVVASGRADKSGGIANPFNAVWIALMHPGLAELLAAWLEAAAGHWDAVRVAGACRPDDEALAVARAINGGAA